MSLIKVRRTATLDGEDKRDGKDSIADKEREYTRLYELAQKNITFHAAKGDSAKVAEWKRKADEYKRLAQEDSIAADAKFKKGDRVRRGKQTGIVRDIEKEPYIEVKFTDQPVTVFVHESEIVADNSRAADACEDSAAKFRIGQEVMVKTKYTEPYKARIVGLWDMSQNGPYDEQGYLVKNIKGGGVESMPEHALSIATAKDSSELNNDADLRAALSKMADIARRLTDAKVSFKAGWTPDGIGEIILDFPNIESARKYNYYKLFNAWDAARSQIVPRWAVNVGGYRVPRIEGNRMTISISHFST